MTSQGAVANSTSFSQDAALVQRYIASRGRALSVSSVNSGDESTALGTDSGLATPTPKALGIGKSKPPYPAGANGDVSHARETDPLLPRADTALNGRVDGEESAWWEELKTLTGYMLPVFGTQLLEYSLNIASVVSIGHISTSALAASTLATMTASVTGYSIVQGFASALDTLMPGAWTGGNPQLVGLWLQRIFILIGVLLVPIIAIWIKSEPILLALRQEPEVAELAGIFLRASILGLPAYCINTCLRRYFQSQGLFSAPTRITIIVAPINAFLNYYLVWGPEPIRLGFVGAPLATGISMNLMTLLYIGYGYFMAPKVAWHPLTNKAFNVKELWLLVQLGGAGVAQITADWWSWELVALAASQLGPVALATQSILLVSASTTYQAPFSLGVATSVRIGNLLGARQPAKAKLTMDVSLGLVLFIGTILSLIFFIFKDNWAYMFNSDPEVVQMVADVLPLAALFQVFDGLGAVIGGILRAKGQQSLGALLNLTGYYVVGIPIGLALTFKGDMGLYGLWAGLTVALIYVAGFGVWICWRTDWDREVEKTAQRLSSDLA